MRENLFCREVISGYRFSSSLSPLQVQVSRSMPHFQVHDTHCLHVFSSLASFSCSSTSTYSVPVRMSVFSRSAAAIDVIFR